MRVNCASKVEARAEIGAGNQAGGAAKRKTAAAMTATSSAANTTYQDTWKADSLRPGLMDGVLWCYMV